LISDMLPCFCLIWTCRINTSNLELNDFFCQFLRTFMVDGSIPRKKNASGHVFSYWMLKWFVVHMLRECLIFIIINKLGLLQSSPFPCCGCNTVSKFETFIYVFLPTKKNRPCLRTINKPYRNYLVDGLVVRVWN